MIVPLAAVGVGIVDLLVASVLMVGLLVWYHVPVTPMVLLAPVFMLGVMLAATGVGALLAALTVTYRDFRYIVPFAVQLWMYASPVVYSATRSAGAVACAVRAQSHDGHDGRLPGGGARPVAVVGPGRDLVDLRARVPGDRDRLLPARRAAVCRCRLARRHRSSSSTT